VTAAQATLIVSYSVSRDNKQLIGRGQQAAMVQPHFLNR
jgi:hypothetical protein